MTLCLEYGVTSSEYVERQGLFQGYKMERPEKIERLLPKTEEAITQKHRGILPGVYCNLIKEAVD